MSIRQRPDKTFYIKCDFDDCRNVVELKAKDFWEASAEAKRLGWRLVKDKDGKWCNFCTGFCEMLYFNPPITVIVKKK